MASATAHTGDGVVKAASRRPRSPRRQVYPHFCGAKEKSLHRCRPDLQKWSLRLHFGPLVIEENIIRLNGSRAAASWLVLDAALDSDDLVVVPVTLRKGYCSAQESAIGLSSHVIARFYQRTQGNSKLRGVALLGRHIRMMIESLAKEEVLPDDEAITATNEGALLWKSQRARTWIGAGSAVDPMLKEAMARATDTNVTVCIVGRSVR
jgi:hypothetical protein